MPKKKLSRVKTLWQVQKATLADVRRAMAKPPVAASARKGKEVQAKHCGLIGTAIRVEVLAW